MNIVVIKRVCTIPLFMQTSAICRVLHVCDTINRYFLNLSMQMADSELPYMAGISQIIIVIKHVCTIPLFLQSSVLSQYAEFCMSMTL